MSEEKKEEPSLALIAQRTSPQEEAKAIVQQLRSVGLYEYVKAEMQEKIASTQSIDKTLGALVSASKTFAKSEQWWYDYWLKKGGHLASIKEIAEIFVTHHNYLHGEDVLHKEIAKNFLENLKQIHRNSQEFHLTASSVKLMQPPTLVEIYHNSSKGEDYITLRDALWFFPTGNTNFATYDNPKHLLECIYINKDKIQKGYRIPVDKKDVDIQLGYRLDELLGSNHKEIVEGIAHLLARSQNISDKKVNVVMHYRNNGRNEERYSNTALELSMRIEKEKFRAGKNLLYHANIAQWTIRTSSREKYNHSFGIVYK